MLPAKHFYMIRHGETVANVDKIMAGSTDSPLTDNGRRQAHDVCTIIDQLKIKPRSISHSHLSRARDTAEIINTVLNVPISEDPDLAELHAGDWEGVPYEDCNRVLDEWFDPPNGETCEEFFARIQRGKAKALNNNESPALIVCHGGVMRAFSRLYGLFTPAKFRNCHLYEFIPHQDQPDFPWQVFHYEFDDELIRTPADLYHAAEEIAS